MYSIANDPSRAARADGQRLVIGIVRRQPDQFSLPLTATESNGQGSLSCGRQWAVSDGAKLTTKSGVVLGSASYSFERSTSEVVKASRFGEGLLGPLAYAGRLACGLKLHVGVKPSAMPRSSQGSGWLGPSLGDPGAGASNHGALGGPTGAHGDITNRAVASLGGHHDHPLVHERFRVRAARVGFDGDTIRIQAETTPPPPELALSLARVWFGDGSSVTLPPPPCHKTVVRFPSPGSLATPAVAHVYKSPGQKEVQIWARLGCGPSQSLQYTTEFVYVYPEAPSAARHWAACQAGQLSGSVTSVVGAMGDVRAVVDVHNTSSRGLPAARLPPPTVDRYQGPEIADLERPCTGDAVPRASSPLGCPVPRGDGVVRHRLRRQP